MNNDVNNEPVPKHFLYLFHNKSAMINIKKKMVEISAFEMDRGTGKALLIIVFIKTGRLMLVGYIFHLDLELVYK